MMISACNYTIQCEQYPKVCRPQPHLKQKQPLDAGFRADCRSTRWRRRLERRLASRDPPRLIDQLRAQSEDEQTAFIVQFQNFLNSLDFTVQILVQSRMLDIRPYVATLEVAYKQQLDDLMRVQIANISNSSKALPKQPMS
jgi:hypothetical protein